MGILLLVRLCLYIETVPSSWIMTFILKQEFASVITVIAQIVATQLVSGTYQGPCDPFSGISCLKFYLFQWLSFSFTDTIITVCVIMFEYMKSYTTLSCLLLVLVPSIRCACMNNRAVKVTGLNISDIPRDLRSDLDYLIINKTNIHTLNLTVAVDYPEMCQLEISKSPLTRIILPSVPHTLPLLNLRIWGGHFPTLPDLGDVLEGQLERLIFSAVHTTTIPDNYFENFTNLISLSLGNNHLSALNAGNMAGLSNLQAIYLGNNQLNPLPPLHQWLPNLKRLSVKDIGISLLPPPLVEYLPNLLRLDLQRNELSTVPLRKHFINMENMVHIRLAGNPLHCDTQLCWIKVIPINTNRNNHVVILAMGITGATINLSCLSFQCLSWAY